MSQELFSPVPSVRLYETVVRQILDLIARGELAPGERLPPERQLAERLSVSRNILREAFRVLEMRGIVHSRGGGGRHIRPDNIAARLTADGVILRLEHAVIVDVLESRELLEVQAARLAAARATPDQLAVIQTACRAEDSGWETNVDFHTAVAAATGNFMLERLVRLQMDLLAEIHQREHYRSADDTTRLLDEHHAIASAIADHDPDAAETAVRHHFAHTRAALINRWFCGGVHA